MKKTLIFKLGITGLYLTVFAVLFSMFIWICNFKSESTYQYYQTHLYGDESGTVVLSSQNYDYVIIIPKWW